MISYGIKVDYMSLLYRLLYNTKVYFYFVDAFLLFKNIKNKTDKTN
ncbi:hypothetical protein BN1200_520019 [Klebsiella variicola]|nr:hypothetical protein BN1200_520019 [Klebsiella variicola]